MNKKLSVRSARLITSIAMGIIASIVGVLYSFAWFAVNDKPIVADGMQLRTIDVEVEDAGFTVYPVLDIVEQTGGTKYVYDSTTTSVFSIAQFDKYQINTSGYKMALVLDFFMTVSNVPENGFDISVEYSQGWIDPVTSPLIEDDGEYKENYMSNIVSLYHATNATSGSEYAVLSDDGQHSFVSLVGDAEAGTGTVTKTTENKMYIVENFIPSLGENHIYMVMTYNFDVATYISIKADAECRYSNDMKFELSGGDK